MPIPSDPPEPFFGWPKKWKDWLFELLDWLLRTQAVPSKVDFEVNEDPNGRRFKLRAARVQALVDETPFRLQILNASASGVGKVRVRLGMMAGLVAASGMTDPGDDPPYIITFGSTTGWKYVYADITVAYDGTTNGTWTATACTILHTSTIPANTATHIYVEIGQVKLEASTGGYAITEITQTVDGDQWVARTSGENSPYIDYNGH